MSQEELEAIKRRIESLESENQKLRAAAHGARQKKVSTVIKTFKGWPVISFEGPFRPFSLGLKKSALILERIEDIRFFVESNRHRLDLAPEHE